MRLRPVASEILRRIMELSCVAGGEILKFHVSAAAGVMHQNGRLGRQFGRCETVAKLAAKNRRYKTNSVADAQ